MKELDDFITMIEEGRFSEAHVVLEHPWKVIRVKSKDEGNILKGLINAASAFELKRIGRDEAAMRIWSAYEKYRPLIETVDSPHRSMYQRCATVVEEKAKSYFK